MRKQQIFFAILLIILCTVFFGCEAVATLFHGERPEPPTVTYTITFDANGATGNPPAEITVTEGGVINLPNIGGMVHSGNTFVGWSESATIGVGTTLFVEDSVTVTRNMVFYAQWVPLGSTQYTISFNANDASGAPPSSKIVYAGVQIIIPDQGSLAYAGRMFGGWNAEKDGSGTLLGAGTLYTVSGSITLYAQWYSSTDSFTVTFHANGGSGEVPSPRTVNANANIELPNGSGLSKDGFIFGGWNTQADGGGTNYAAGYLYTVTGIVTLYAKWNSFFASVTEVDAYLASQSGGYDPDEPVYLPVEINLGNMTQNGSGWRQLLNIVASSGKYVELDLSACTMTGTEFDPDNTIITGKDKIVSITLPNTATGTANSWHMATFRGFTVLESLNGAGLTSIGDYAFAQMYLALASLPEGITSIGNSAFSECRNANGQYFGELALTKLPDGLKTIGDQAFYGSNLAAITSLPTGLISIGDQALTSFRNLTIISLPALTSIGNGAFDSCVGLTSVTMPASVNIGDNSFARCTSLNSFILTGTGSLSVIEGGRALVRNNTELVAYPAASGNVTLPAGITSIGNSAFSWNDNLSQITLPAGITSIGNNAFYVCSNLTQITLPVSITSIGNYAFYQCINLTQITLPTSLTSIGGGAFGYRNLVVTCLAQTPPMLEGPFIQVYVDSSLAIKVPAGSVEAYKAAEGWSEYADRISAIE